MIPKTKDTSKHKYNKQYGQTNQNNITSNTVKATKVIQSAIRSEQSKQYDQSNTISNTVRPTKAIKLKQYNQQSNQKKSGGGKNYIINSTYAKIIDPNKAWYSGGSFSKIKNQAIPNNIC